jgi:hypothetical protein
MTNLMSISAIVIALSAAGAYAQPRAANEAAHYYQVQRNAPIVDQDGWRLRGNARGWDHSCLNIAEPAMFACSAN